jgi:predicted dehydrogenase
MSTNRRRFIAGASAASFGLPLLLSAQARGANDEIRVGVVGLGIRGTGAHIPGMAPQHGVKIVAVCDPDRSRSAAAAKLCEKNFRQKVDRYADVRKLLDRKDVDVVCIATQQYWHALGAIWACQAGKHVYVEKPASHYIWEGRQMVNAARRYRRIVQCGTQQRSNHGTRAAVEWIRAGNLGKIKLITTFANKPRASVGKRATPLPIPPEVDYDLWCGPAKRLPIYRDRLQYDCSFDWNTGDGESANQGVHEIDVARWILGETELPRRVMSIGGRFIFNDAADCPNTQIIYYDFPTAPVLYEVHNLRTAKGSKEIPDFRGLRGGVAVDCEGGSVLINGGGKAFDPQGKLIKTFRSGDDHFVNFIEAVRSGRREKLHAEILEGHLSTRICHAGNISYRLGRQATQAEIRPLVRDIPEWNAMFDRLLVHLRAHAVDVDAPSITMGPWLETVPGQECFVDNAAANALVKGFYRKPYVVPEVKI